MSSKFTRQDSKRHSKLGKNRKRLQKWRKPKGRDSKMRLSRKGYPKTVSIGYKSQNKKTLTLIRNLKDLDSVTKEQFVILAKIGAKKKLEIISMAEKKKIPILNIQEKKK